MSAFDLDDVLNIEDNEVSAEEYWKSVQRAINSGDAWSFQGSYGRLMMDAIEGGRCMLGVKPARDYWGNFIPSRDGVVSGSKGSRAYVVAHHGEDWAVLMEGA